jgi:hypothetical protein
MTQEFKVGDRVKAIAYTDCFGKEHAEISGLVRQKRRYLRLG